MAARVEQTMLVWAPSNNWTFSIFFDSFVFRVLFFRLIDHSCSSIFLILVSHSHFSLLNFNFSLLIPKKIALKVSFLQEKTRKRKSSNVTKNKKNNNGEVKAEKGKWDDNALLSVFSSSFDGHVKRRTYCVLDIRSHSLPTEIRGNIENWAIENVF